MRQRPLRFVLVLLGHFGTRGVDQSVRGGLAGEATPAPFTFLHSSGSAVHQLSLCEIISCCWANPDRLRGRREHPTVPGAITFDWRGAP